MEIENDQEKKWGERSGPFKCKLGSCLGWGLQAGKKTKNQQKRIGNEEPTEMAALGPGKVSMGNGKNIKSKRRGRKILQ